LSQRRPPPLFNARYEYEPSANKKVVKQQANPTQASFLYGSFLLVVKSIPKGKGLSLHFSSRRWGSPHPDKGGFKQPIDP